MKVGVSTSAKRDGVTLRIVISHHNSPIAAQSNIGTVLDQVKSGGC